MRELDAAEVADLENVFKDGIAALLLYAPLCAAQQQLQPNKFWKALETLVNDVLDKVGLFFKFLIIFKKFRSACFINNKQLFSCGYY